MSGKGKDLQDTENERVRKSHKQKVLRMHALQYKAQFSYEWQAKDLQDTENERVRKLLKTKDENLDDSCAGKEKSVERERREGKS